MKYVVLTLVPRLQRRPKPGESSATGIREEGCLACDIKHDGKLKPCWKHTHEHILWAEKEEIEDVLSEGTAVQAEGVPEVQPTTGYLEPVEVS